MFPYYHHTRSFSFFFLFFSSPLFYQITTQHSPNPPSSLKKSKEEKKKKQEKEEKEQIRKFQEECIRVYNRHTFVFVVFRQFVRANNNKSKCMIYLKLLSSPRRETSMIVLMNFVFLTRFNTVSFSWISR